MTDPDLGAHAAVHLGTRTFMSIDAAACGYAERSGRQIAIDDGLAVFARETAGNYRLGDYTLVWRGGSCIARSTEHAFVVDVARGTRGGTVRCQVMQELEGCPAPPPVDGPRRLMIAFVGSHADARWTPVSDQLRRVTPDDIRALPLGAFPDEGARMHGRVFQPAEDVRYFDVSGIGLLLVRDRLVSVQNRPGQLHGLLAVAGEQFLVLTHEFGGFDLVSLRDGMHYTGDFPFALSEEPD